MTHCLVVGRTGTGKTTICRNLSKSFFEKEIPVLVLDPFKDPKWFCDFITDNPAEFLQVVFSNTRCQLFIDESGDMIGRFGQEMNQVATRSRHYGHAAFFLSQRATQVDKTTRSQCEHLIMFKQGTEDSKILYKEFVCPELLEGPNLNKGECIIKRGFDPAYKFDVFQNKKI